MATAVIASTSTRRAETLCRNLPCAETSHDRFWVIALAEGVDAGVMSKSEERMSRVPSATCRPEWYTTDS